VRNDLLVRDASCAAGTRARNAATIASAAPASAAEDVRQIQVLIDQIRAAVARAVEDGDLDRATADVLESDLDGAEAHLTMDGLASAATDLLRVCNAI